MNGIIDKRDYPSALDVKTKPANTVKKQKRDLSSKIDTDVQPIFTSKKLEQDLKLKEIQPGIVNQHSVIYCFNVTCVIQITSDT